MVSPVGVLFCLSVLVCYIEARAVSFDSQRAARILHRVDQLLDGPPQDHINAYELLLNYEEEMADNIEFMWRIAKATRMAGLACGGKGDDDKKKELFYQALEYAKIALAADDTHSQVQKWYAVTVGGLEEYLSAGDRLRNGLSFKEHIDRALELNPNDGESYYLLGRFKYEIAVLSWFEKRMAAALFAELPESTVEEALDLFMKSYRLSRKPRKELWLYIARCHIQNYDYAEAIDWIDRAMDLPVINHEDEAAQKALEGLQWKYSGYRRS